MELRKLFPRVVVATLALSILSVSAFAQTRPRVASNGGDVNDVSCSPDEFAVLAANESESKPVWEAKSKPTIDLAPSPSSSGSGFIKVEPLLMSAIDQRLGSPYRWGATGPNRFDCSGFVWSIYQATGINFERASARTLFARFEAPPVEEQFKFGTLVFFSGLTHVGVVADAHGFYHASRRHGVIYSEFNEYWLKRIDGFRRVPKQVQVAQAGN
ncbi:MAG TPA: C40 family peptidase [Pyrinomonadaceae bacterium]|jgi:peptidoglycan endopeptidase LytE|nr:C40 family peptidase [Pyrinomonadaceae bacterium]